jgi:hypothetical protein
VKQQTSGAITQEIDRNKSPLVYQYLNDLAGRLTSTKGRAAVELAQKLLTFIPGLYLPEAVEIPQAQTVYLSWDGPGFV